MPENLIGQARIRDDEVVRRRAGSRRRRSRKAGRKLAREKYFADITQLGEGHLAHGHAVDLMGFPQVAEQRRGCGGPGVAARCQGELANLVPLHHDLHAPVGALYRHAPRRDRARGQQ